MTTSCARGRFLLLRGVLFLVIVMACAGRLGAQSPTLEVLQSFSGDPAGANPEAPVIQGSDGNFYGTTYSGGNGSGDGTIFEVTSEGLLTLYTFDGVHGANPQAGLTLGSDGNFYGTTANGGPMFGDGTVFQITPAGVLTTLYAFTGDADGAFPEAKLIQGSDGNFYGTTEAGGTAYGTIFKITPAGASTTLYTFTGGAGGANPQSGLTQDSHGNLYGTTSAGGNSAGDGTIYEITSAGAFSTLYTFTGGADGANPEAGLILGNDGNFYGTANGGNSSSLGTVFKMTPAGVLTTLHTFTGGAGGAHPVGDLIQGSDGNFYGATGEGFGTVFRITPAGVFTTLYSFTGGLDGSQPQAGVIQGTDGNLYGSAFLGGLHNLGAVFRLTLPIPAVLSETTSTQLNSAFSFQIVATNGPTSFGASNLPDGLTVDAGAGLISGAPTRSGTYNIGLTATNAFETGAGTLTLTVDPPAPEITNAPTATAQVGQAFNYQITANDGPTSFGASGLPDGLTIDASTGLISGTPTAASTSPVLVILTATNPGGTDSAELSLTINPAAPVITSALTATGQVGQAFSYQIAASNSPTSFSAAGLPYGLNVDDATGIISGTLTANVVDSVIIQADNAGGVGTSILTLTVTLPAVTLTPIVPETVLGSGQPGVFRLSLPAPQSADVVVSYTIKGSAINGLDYQLIKGVKKIKAGKTSKNINIIPQGDLGGASMKIVTLVLDPGVGYAVGTAGKVKVKILSAP